MSEQLKRRPLLIDTDCGVDDALAIVLAMRSPEGDVQSIVTVAGNVEVTQCTRNVLKVLSVLGPSIYPRVSQGAARPLKRTLVTAKEVHGQDGLGDAVRMPSVHRRLDVPRNGARAIVDFCREWKSEGTIIALGPLTNIARAWRLDPTTLRRIGRIISMGGAFRIPGNTGPVAEFNYFVDPEAAKTVIASGLPLEIIPLDITHQVTLLRREVELRLKERPGRISRFVSAVTRSYMAYHERTEGFNGGYLHDPVAVAAACDPTLFEFAESSVGIETEGKIGRGMTVRFPGVVGRHGDGSRARTGAVRIASRIDRERFLTWFHERLWG